ncbi:MAG: tRNA (adenosine(37)-N6)-threonylcarbamoyltransferase complex dimerization subunit type 1 TsaB [Proteobacteria bacterium]|nr:tRNA (adenosine(37)-N6)-threonylcarbamoyltransferase complex dimerization subunit type 1 TsaB [Pseudomonadota bacterium]
MPTILAIETSAELASVALLRDGQLTTLESSGVHTHSDTILPMTQRLLTQAGIAIVDCDAIAFGCGPGSFTGVRTACGVVQGLAFGSEKSVVPVVSLLAMAEACRETCGARDVLAVLDARMGEVYWAQYRYAEQDGGHWRAVIAPTLSSAAAVQPQGMVQACGNGLRAYATDFSGRDFFAAGLMDILPHAAPIARLGQQAYARGEVVPAQDAQPLYLRNKVALTTNERLAKAEGVAAGMAT